MIEAVDLFAGGGGAALGLRRAGVRCLLRNGQVRAIRAEYTGERGQLTRLGERYGVSRVNIANIVKGRWWKSIL